MTLPKFPAFRTLTLDDKAMYRKAYAKIAAPYSDFSLHELFTWLNFKNDIFISSFGKNHILRYTDTLRDNTTAYSVLGNTLDHASLIKLFEVTSELRNVTAEMVKSVDSKWAIIEEDRDNSDYVCDIKESAKMAGTKRENFRGRVNSFLRNYGTPEIRDLDVRSEKQLIVTALNEWIVTHNDPAREELEIIRRHIGLADKLDVRCFGIFVSGKLISFVIYHFPPHPGWAIVNHLKFDYSYQNIFGYSFYILIQKLNELGYHWLNYEQDLGIPGLRKTKKLLVPSHLLARYTLRRR